MSFNMGGAMSGASAGMALGPWGAAAGGLLGGLFGGDSEPELYSAEMYARDMAPYQDMVNQQQNQANMMQDPNSWLNRQQNQNIMQNSMDQMGTANMLSSRQNAGNPYINAGGIQNQMQQNNLLGYANQGLQQGRENFQSNFGSGTQVMQNAMTHQGDISSGLANLMAGNIGTMNEYQQGQDAQMQQGLGGMLGGISGMGDLNFDAQGNNLGMSPGSGWKNFIGMSDVELKENIELVGKSPKGVNIYEFDYKDKSYGEGRYRGVMAQEVPNASFKQYDGYLWVNYNKVDVDFERIS